MAGWHKHNRDQQQRKHERAPSGPVHQVITTVWIDTDCPDCQGTGVTKRGATCLGCGGRGQIKVEV